MDIPDSGSTPMPQLIENIAKHDYIGFNPTKSGDLPNYKVVPDFLRFNKKQTSQLAQISQASVRYDEKIPNDLAERLEQIANIANRVAALFDGDIGKAALWFRTRNSILGQVAPRDMVRLNRFKRLAKFVTEAEQQR
ncbi:MAG: hypothetical protein IIB76_10645 [Proteobacteria bacterium]|nr:hypothetical protein [Pseudomonadota bacterium]